MLISEGIEVHDFYSTNNDYEFIGYLPVLDIERHSYYTLENLNTKSVHKRVSAIFGLINSTGYLINEFRFNNPYTKLEFKKYKIRGSYEDYLESQIKIKKEVLDKPYVLVFVGCDDGDVGMRFKDKEQALEFLEIAENFDDVYFHPDCNIVS